MKHTVSGRKQRIEYIEQVAEDVGYENYKEIKSLIGRSGGLHQTGQMVDNM